METQVIEPMALADESVEPIAVEVVEPTSQRKRKNDSLRIPSGTLDRWNLLLASRFPEQGNQADRMLALLEVLESGEMPMVEPEAEPSLQEVEAVPVPASAHFSELEQVKATLEAMMERLSKLEHRRDRACA